MARDHGNNQWKLPELRKAIEKEINILQEGEPTETRDYLLHFSLPEVEAPSGDGQTNRRYPNQPIPRERRVSFVENNINPPTVKMYQLLRQELSVLNVRDFVLIV